jgi:2-polyprenyl-6-methoxyphenol hydroxylase-like FAD-dependent oxidoreductase
MEMGSMSKRTVAIAGAGIAGFAAAAALTRHGFDVRIYERSEEPREFGAGIYLKENSLPIFDALGIGERIANSGVRMKSARIVDETGTIIVDRQLDKERLIVVLREEVHGALRDVALAGGAELITGRKVVGASRNGVLFLEGGESVEADLVIGADGVHSRVRESLRLTRTNRLLGDGATRVVIPREEEPYSTEYWSGQHRVGVAPCSKDLTYCFIIGPEREPRVTRLPLDKEYWTQKFPHLASVFARVTGGVHHAHPFITCKSWVAGRAAIIGDAAHAQPPNFGQGAGVAIVASWQMAEILATHDDIAQGLLAWEKVARPRVNMVQWLTTAYDIAGYKWPPALAPMRAWLFRTLSKAPVTSRKWEYYWRGGCDAPLPGHLASEADA